MKRLATLGMLLILMLGLTGLAAAAEKKEPKGDQPIHVVSDRLEVDNKAQIATFIGKVKATQGDVVITSDRMEVYYDRDEKAAEADKAKQKKDKKEKKPTGLMDSGGKVRKVIALGHVKIVQRDRVGVGQKATYWAGGRKILLEGQATVWQNKNTVSGEKITVFLDEDRSVVHGKPGKRVTVTIVPGSKR